MRLASYLCTSRHGVFCLRYPIPSDLHPDRKRGHIKFSLATRDPREAGNLARLLAAAGHSILNTPIVHTMRYDEIREHVRDHFAKLLEKQREAIAKDGLPTQSRMMALKATLGLAEEGPEGFMDIAHPNDRMAPLSQFCTSRDIPMPDGLQSKQMMEDEFFKGFRDFLKRAIDLPSEFDTITIVPSALRDIAHELKGEPASDHETALTYDETVSRYFDELQHTKPLAPKTMSDKRDALALLRELTDGKPTSDMTKRDAQAVKAALLKLPKNRRTNPATRDLPNSPLSV